MGWCYVLAGFYVPDSAKPLLWRGIVGMESLVIKRSVKVWEWFGTQLCGHFGKPGMTNFLITWRVMWRRLWKRLRFCRGDRVKSIANVRLLVLWVAMEPYRVSVAVGLSCFGVAVYDNISYSVLITARFGCCLLIAGQILGCWFRVFRYIGDLCLFSLPASLLCFLYTLDVNKICIF